MASDRQIRNTHWERKVKLITPAQLGKIKVIVPNKEPVIFVGNRADRRKFLKAYKLVIKKETK